MFCAAALIPAIASASGGGVTRETFESVLTGFAIIGAAYLISHLVFERLARRFAIVSGVEYVLLGALAGPIFGLISGAVRTSLHPFMVLGTSALAMMAGLEFDLRRGGIGGRDLAVTALIVGATAALFLGPPVVGFVWFERADLLDAWMLPLVAALSVALIADYGPVRAFTNFFDARGPELARAERVAALCTAAGLVVFGSLFCFSDGIHEGPIHDRETVARLAGLQTLLGLVLGGVFTLFLRRKLSNEQRLTVVIGMITFAAGLAYFIHISAIAANFLIGAVVINASSQGETVRGMLREIRRPFYIVLFFFTGVDLITDVPLVAYLLAIPYVVLRLWGRRLGGALARRLEARSHIPSNLGNALTAPGGLSIGVCLMILLFFGDVGAIPAGDDDHAGAATHAVAAHGDAAHPPDPHATTATRPADARSDPTHANATPPDLAHSDPTHSDPTHSDPTHSDPARPDPTHSEAARSDAAHPDAARSDAAHARPGAAALPQAHDGEAHVEAGEAGDPAAPEEHPATPMRMITAALIFGVVFTEVMAYVLTRRWILDAADVAPERAARRGGFTDEGG